VKIEELAAGVGHAANFGNALLRAGIVAREIVADQLAIPLTQKTARVLASTAGLPGLESLTQSPKLSGSKVLWSQW
jgi:hypothetical protein